MPSARALNFTALYIFPLLVFLSFPLFAGGQGEERLEQVDELIETRLYGEALRLLNQVMLDSPEYWDRAQERMDVLLAIVDRKNDLENQIYEAMVEGDVDLAFDRLEELRIFDPKPNAEAEALISEIVFNIGIIRNDNLLRELMARAEPVLATGDRFGAIEIYLSGFEIGKSIFETTDYGSQLVDVVETVRANLGVITGATDRFEEGFSVYTALLEDHRTIASDLGPVSDTDPLRENLLGLIPLLLALDSDVRRIDLLNSGMQLLRKSLRDQITTLEDIYYLSYIDILVKGRTDRRGREGILAALDVGLSSDADSIIASLRELLDETYREAVATYSTDDFGAAEAHFTEVETRHDLLYAAAPLAAYRVRPGEGIALDPEESLFARSQLSLIAGAEARVSAASRYLSAMPFFADAEALVDPSPGTPREALESYRRSLQSALSGAEREAMETETAADRYRTLSGFLSPPEQELFSPMLRDLASEVERLQRVEAVVVGDIIDRRVSEVQSAYSPAQPERVEEARGLLAGENTGPGNGFTAGITVHRFPTEAGSLLDRTARELTMLDTDVVRVVDSYSNEPDYILESEPFRSAISDATELRETIARLDAEAERIASEAVRIAADAAALRSSALESIAVGERLLEENDNLFGEGEYLEARDTVLPAAVRAAVSALELEWDGEFRDTVDEWSSSFSDRIVTARSDLLKRLTTEAVAAADTYLDRTEDDMQEDEYLAALRLLDPARTALDRTVGFRRDDEFEALISSRIALLETAIREARANELRSLADEAFASAEEYYESVRGDMQEPVYLGALGRIEPVVDAYEIAEAFAPDSLFLSRITRAINTLSTDIEQARAETLRGETMVELVRAEQRLANNRVGMTAVRYAEVLATLPPVETRLAAAEEFKRDAEFRAEVEERIDAIRSGAEDARAVELRRITDEALVDAEAYLAANRAAMSAAQYGSALESLLPVEAGLEIAEAFQSNLSFRLAVTSRVSAVRSGATDARASELRRLTVAALVTAEAFLDQHRDEMTAARFASALAGLPPVEERFGVAEAFQPNEPFRSEISARIAAVRTGAENARAALLRAGTEELLVRAERYLEANAVALTRALYDSRTSYLEPVAAALGDAEAFQPDSRFRSDIEIRVAALESGFADAHLAFLQADTYDRLAEARDYFEANRINMSGAEYLRALDALEPVVTAVTVSQTFRADPAFFEATRVAVDVLETEIRLARAEQLRDEAVALLDRAAEQADSGIAAANRDDISTATDAFGAAREYLQQAASRTGEADEIIADPVFSATIDSRTTVLQQRIVDTEIAIVVREVRRLITRAQDAYGSGEYELAYRHITEAEARWADASTDPNTEIEYWFNIVNNARQALSGREIEVTDPRYDTVRAWLNNAQADFQIGRKMLESGDEEGALAKFKEAEDGLLAVRALFPLNQEAGLLRIRIAKLTRPRSEYEVEIRSLVNEARDYFDENDVARAYALLADIREIEPRYPGLDALILEAEYRLGIKERPIDPVVLANAQRYYDQARSIFTTYRTGQYDTEIRQSQFRRALDLLDEALRLNPRLTAASILKDEVSTSIGSDVKLALSSEDQREFERARDLYIEDNKVAEAFLITSVLVSKEANLGFRALVDLHSRLVAELNN